MLTFTMGPGLTEISGKMNFSPKVGEVAEDLISENKVEKRHDASVALAPCAIVCGSFG